MYRYLHKIRKKNRTQINHKNEKDEEKRNFRVDT